MAEGNYIVEVSKDGYDTQKVTKHVKKNIDNRHTIPLKKTNYNNVYGKENSVIKTRIYYWTGENKIIKKIEILLINKKMNYNDALKYCQKIKINGGGWNLLEEGYFNSLSSNTKLSNKYLLLSNINAGHWLRPNPLDKNRDPNVAGSALTFFYDEFGTFITEYIDINEELFFYAARDVKIR